MIKPKPFKVKCTKCEYSKVVAPKSDCLTSLDFPSSCPKCDGDIEMVELSMMDKILYAYML